MQNEDKKLMDAKNQYNTKQTNLRNYQKPKPDVPPMIQTLSISSNSEAVNKAANKILVGTMVDSTIPNSCSM